MNLREQRRELQSLCRDYAEMIWEAGGETRLAHDAEANGLRVLEMKVAKLREYLEQHP